jgi:iron complex transport system ATP-binding protein
MQAFINIQELVVGYKSGKHEKVLSQALNLTADRGDLIALIGANGIGKSTLVKTLCKLHQPISGKVYIGNKCIDDTSNLEMAQAVSVVSTALQRSSRLTVFDVVSLGRFPYLNWFGRLGPTDEAAVKMAIESVGMLGFIQRDITSLSDGEYQRVMIARALAQDTPIIVLDEPTAFLDLPNKYAIVELLWKLTREQNKLVLFTTHDLNVALQFSDYFWVYNQQKIIKGTPEDLILSGTLEHLFDQRSVFFHKETGQFKLHKNHTKQIGIEGDERWVSLTWMALDRLGYEVVCNKSIPNHVKVTAIGNKLRWELDFENKQYYLASIEELQNILK